MKDRKSLQVALLVSIIGCCSYPLIAGLSLLNWQLFGELPLGNVLAALVIASLACLVYLLRPRNIYFTVIAWVCLLMAFLWFPVSALLAGNLQLLFSGDKGQFWTIYTRATVIISLAALLVILSIKLFQFIRLRFKQN